jgi:hypothetical protein
MERSVQTSLFKDMFEITASEITAASKITKCLVVTKTLAENNENVILKDNHIVIKVTL